MVIGGPDTIHSNKYYNRAKTKKVTENLQN